MERLTDNTSYCTSWSDCEIHEDRCPILSSCYDRKIYNKLKAYEDAEEQGLLIRVPSRKVWESSGDAVYYIYDYEIVECINCGISVDCEGNIWIALACDEDIFPYRTPIPEIDTSFEDWCKNSTDVKIEEWGKTVFLAREEAEAALERMGGGKNGNE